ncbi:MULTISPECIES: flagellar hook capping FlgD N-terminal domain-containing protein [unclassified Neptuniibacter]|uniref:flagellar hook assembly protein FlgD n=1 Tax=unclassified Neptuniibacter TaxID=2630693 RepID=UPI000C606E4C|nr:MULTISPECIES: flagellar hook capping FlgD N-terminal domain-containing protein [unclassified Neptuniibacter]MAY42260.1 flagellar biosynthesis protein FlgD [Oceanospirillaceae bacterium]|tara:strand:- start:20428 stop:21126 length:699 start_codon:yes stop_codon:yes gene_type:complete
MSNVNGVNQNIFEQINTTNQSSSTAKSQTEEDSDMFMRLMIAQLQNQDPSSPADTSDFMQQIATMSQVESINQLNSSVNEMSQSMLSSQAALQASAMVGQSVYIPGDTVEVGTASSPYAHGSFNLGTSSSDVRIKVYNSSGSLVDTMQLGAVSQGEHEFAWQMQFDEDGNPEHPPGDYTFTVERIEDEEYKAVDTNMAYRVNSVTLGENGIGMKVNTNAGTFDASDVKQIGV